MLYQVRLAKPRCRRYGPLMIVVFLAVPGGCFRVITDSVRNDMTRLSIVQTLFRDVHALGPSDRENRLDIRRQGRNHHGH
ncbi:uncharacterized protein ARMOST_20678 [Armillaria ostoyae]|uniref:Uncharacterized protein n=1 Tax=Armillaria ostoyae TaxID=47428 RepID=A0A284S805_ARMOS|nr:uncharacterized protein ARMOST_20678 [Armillaria ostoyae]